MIAIKEVKFCKGVFGGFFGREIAFATKIFLQ